MIQSVIFTCSLQPRLSSFHSMLMPVHLQSSTVSCSTQARAEKKVLSFFSFFSFLCDGQFRLLCFRTSIPLIILIIIIIPISKLNKNERLADLLYFLRGGR